MQLYYCVLHAIIVLCMLVQQLSFMLNVECQLFCQYHPLLLCCAGNGDVFSYQDWQQHLISGQLSTVMVARAALIKPWVFTGVSQDEG